MRIPLLLLALAGSTYGAAITGILPSIGAFSSTQINTAGAADSVYVGAVSSTPGIWMGTNTGTPSLTNYSVLYSSSTSILNAPTTVALRIANTTIASATATGLTVSSSLSLTSSLTVMPQIAAGGTPASNTALIYSKDVAGTAEVFVKDEAGNETQISPHATTSPAPVELDATSSAALPIVLHHSNEYLGQEEWVHLSALAKEVERLSGKQFVFSRPLPAERVKDWTTEQAQQAQSRTKEIATWQARKAAADKAGQLFAEDRPGAFTPEPKPASLQRRQR